MIDLAGCYRGKRVLVTGDLGFKGRYLKAALTKLDAITSGFDIGRLRGQIQDIRLPWMIRGMVEVFRPDVIFHLAAQAFVPVGYTNPALTFETNAMGTVNLLEAVRLHAPNAVAVIVTTDKVYGSTNDREADERWPLSGSCPYSASKVMAEEAVRAYHASYGLTLATARAGNVIGGGDWGTGRLMPNVIRALREGKTVSVYNPRAVRPWQYVEDVIDGYLRLGAFLAGRPTYFTGSAFNFGPTNHYTVAQVVQEVIRSWGSGSWEWTRVPLHEVEELRIDSSKARSVLGWEPKETLESMIVKTVTSYEAGCKEGV